MLETVAGFILIAVLLTVSLWALYNVPIIATGVRDYCKKRQKSRKESSSERYEPTFSIIVPVKNEGNVVGRLLTALSKLNYPAQKTEIIVVEDGSTDNTANICTEFAKKHENVRVLQGAKSNGKPSALNYGLVQAKGDIVAVFDADNVPDPEALMTVSGYFKESDVAAVQGRTASINGKQNMLTQFISYEEAVWCEAYLRGKDVLNLFVHLRGSCQFIRRDVLNKLEGFNEAMLSEDMEISARLTENNYKIRYASDVIAWQESPSDWKTLFKQRTRWYRGTMQVALRYGRLMASPSLKRFDAETTLFGPFMLIATLLPYIGMFWTFFQIVPFDALWHLAVQFATISSALTMLICGLAMVYVTKPRRKRNILWLPFVYVYWSMQALIALYAALLILLRRPSRWTKTEKSGLDNSTLRV
jgi:cellulose synthase/poly-beta-1,6-N-acetylglucosamine synthase-like glycosyltransferase